jgi:hypothetical protein
MNSHEVAALARQDDQHPEEILALMKAGSKKRVQANFKGLLK